MILLLVASAFAQDKPFEERDTRALTAAGRLDGQKYLNVHGGFVVLLPQPPCNTVLNSKVDLATGSALLVQCHHLVQGLQGMYAFDVFTELWSHYPLKDVSEYVHGMRQVGEKDSKMKVVEAETTRHWAGLPFTEVILNDPSPLGPSYQGLSCTHLRVYILCFKVQASSPEEVKKLLNLDGRLTDLGSGK